MYDYMHIQIVFLKILSYVNLKFVYIIQKYVNVLSLHFAIRAFLRKSKQFGVTSKLSF